MPERTPLTDEQLAALMGPLNGARVQSRNQGGRALSYLAGWDVKATLVRVFGFGGFSSEVLETKVLEINRIPISTTDAPTSNTTSHVQVEVLAQVTVRLEIHQLGAVYTETAASSQKGRDVGEVADFAIKTAATDALKRCAINLGTQFGLSLYDNSSRTEVIRRIFAPGQEWPKVTEPTEEQQKTLSHSLGQRTDGDPSADASADETPADAGREWPGEQA